MSFYNYLDKVTVCRIGNSEQTRIVVTRTRSSPNTSSASFFIIDLYVCEGLMRSYSLSLPLLQVPYWNRFVCQIDRRKTGVIVHQEKKQKSSSRCVLTFIMHLVKKIWNNNQCTETSKRLGSVVILLIKIYQTFLILFSAMTFYLDHKVPSISRCFLFDKELFLGG